MRDTNLLQLALGLTPPWRVTRSDFDPAARRLDIQLDFPPGSRFPCPSCGAANCPAYDTEQMIPVRDDINTRPSLGCRLTGCALDPRSASSRRFCKRR